MNDFLKRVSLKWEKGICFLPTHALEKAHLTDLKRLPFSIRIMLKAALRQCNEQRSHRKVGRLGGLRRRLTDALGIPGALDGDCRDGMKGGIELDLARTRSANRPCAW